MSHYGVQVTAACVALGAPWAIVGSWKGRDGTLCRTARATLGGIAAAELAWGAYGVLDLVGFSVRSEWFERGDWVALGLAGIIGAVEEGAKLAGALIAFQPLRRDPRDRTRVVLAVAAAFATVEAALVLPGASWPVVLGRAACAPVAHALLAVPVALAFGSAVGETRVGAALKVGGGLLVAATLHALGDFSLTQPAWGRAGFAATLLAPAIWLYLRGQLGRRGIRDAVRRARRARWPAVSRQAGAPS